MAAQGDDGEGGQGRLATLLASPKLRLGVLGAVIVAGTAAFLLAGTPSPATVGRLVDDAGWIAPVVFVLAYAALTVLLFPGSVLTAAGGAAFGLAAGVALSVLGATLGAVAAFLIGRRVGRGQVERIAGRRLGRLDRWLERRGFLAVLYTRLLPVLPFNALNYAAGVTGVRTRDYVLATAIGIVPGAFAYAALGGTLDDPTSPEFLAAVALVIVLAVGAPLVDRALRRRGAVAPPAEETADESPAASGDG